MLKVNIFMSSFPNGQGMSYLDDDPVVSEHDLYISTHLSPYLHIIQHTGNIIGLEGDSTTLAGRFKKNHKLYELELPIDTAHSTFSSERSQELAIASQTGQIKLQGSSEAINKSSGVSSLKLTGSKVALSADSKYFVAVCAGGILSCMFDCL